jgi:hypothetical protein
MTGLDAYEQAIARQIKALRVLADRESEKRQALIDANLDLFDKCQALCDDTFAEVMEYEATLVELAAKIKLDLPPTVQARERMAKLAGLRDQAAAAANEQNQINQQIVKTLLDELTVQRGHLRQGRVALKGYGRGLKLHKPPSIISGDV